MSYVDQSHEGLLPEKSIFEIISDGNDLIQVGNTSVNARAYISRFNFSGSDQQKKLGVLSGGERNRVHLAMTLKDGGNVLLLDEPTNDIDVNTLRALEDALDDFAGCALIISHDRWFIDRLATHILAFEDDAQVVFFEGNFTDYEAAKRAKLGDVTPHRPRVKHILP
jgi:ATPase subunit of ABC transporter with duplicated ATPase domains